MAWERSLWQSTVLRGRFWKWPLARVKRAFAQRFRTRMDALGVAHPDVFFGTVHAGSVDLPLLRRFLAEKGVRNLFAGGMRRGGSVGDMGACDRLCEAPSGPFRKMVPDTFSGLVEIGLHPGEAAEDESPEDRANGWHDPLAASRPNELRMLCSAELPAFLESAGWRLGRLGM